MTFMWLMMPGGLETFFARIGRERKPGDPQPPNFPRPADVLQIEAETVFGKKAERFFLHYNFPSCADHTGDGSGMLLVNGSGTPDASIWCQTITVTRIRSPISSR